MLCPSGRRSILSLALQLRRQSRTTEITSHRSHYQTCQLKQLPRMLGHQYWRVRPRHLRPEPSPQEASLLRKRVSRLLNKHCSTSSMRSRPIGMQMEAIILKCSISTQTSKRNFLPISTLLRPILLHKTVRIWRRWPLKRPSTVHQQLLSLPYKLQKMHTSCRFRLQ